MHSLDFDFFHHYVGPTVPRPTPASALPIVDTVLPHVKQREWLPSAVHLGPAFDLEPEPPIEGHRFPILLVYVHGASTQLYDGVLREAPAESLTMARRVDKQCLDLAFRDPDKANDPALTFAKANQVLKRNQAWEDQWLEELDVRLGEEMVGGANGGLPCLQQARAVGRSERPNVALGGQMITSGSAEH